MAARNKPYEQFGPYILFRKFESDSLGDLWRAALIDKGQLGPALALRRMSGGNRAAMAKAATQAGAIVPQLNGTSFVREQVAGTVDGVPFLAWSYAGGRSLRYLMDRARGGKDAAPSPLPLDQAIVIAEKVALSLATMADLRDGSGTRLSHGALLPQFIWIGDDGEIRVAGQQFGPGITASLGDPRVAADVAAYFAPESRGGAAPKPGDIYSMGAVLFLLVTGHEPPDAASASAFASAVRAAKTPAGTPIPDDIRIVLDKSLNLDPSMRYASMGDMKQAISALAHGGRYSATTFNLAFYLSNTLKAELEAEPAEREKESKVNVAPYLEAPAPRPAAPPAPAPPPMFSTSVEPKKKSLMPFVVGAAAAVAAGAGLAWFMLARTPATPAPAPKTAAAVAPVPRPVQPPISEPVVASANPEAPTSTAGQQDGDQKKAFEDAVRQKLQAELMKLQSDYMTELKQRQSKNAPVAAAPVPVQAAPAEERPAVSAAQLDQQRRETARPEPAVETPQVAATQTTAPAAAPPPVTQTASAPARQVAAIREGDVVEYGLLDALPRPLRPINPTYPAIARQQKIAATVFMTVLVTETGDVAEVKVLRGDARFGINDAAMRAMRATRFSPPMKEGKRVRTWFPQTIQFRP